MVREVISRKAPNVFQGFLGFLNLDKFFGVDLNVYEDVENGSDFVNIGRPLLNKLIENKYKNVVLRGELNGGHLKGSGNKNNPARKTAPNIKLFGYDIIINGVALKQSELDFSAMCKNLEFDRCKVIFSEKINTREELEKRCNDYFKENMIEGIVVRTLDSKFSAKFMNNVYDSKK